ncbi:hypothetical protein CCASP_01780 [Corynebacterium caspium DSM 44850]|nr:hypothetical protein CCASP_01780 [Corynebacterium caspium DSM 44850]
MDDCCLIEEEFAVALKVVREYVERPKFGGLRDVVKVDEKAFGFGFS